MTNQEFLTLIESSRDLTVLYVEDNDEVRNSTLTLLEDFFSNIDWAVNGEHGLEKYNNYYNDNGHYYDIVITDINMPKMDGIEMSQSILNTYEDQIVIIISAYNETEYLLKLINMGISNFILKPIEINQFKKILIRVIASLQNKRLIKEHYAEIKTVNHNLKLAKEEAEQASMQKSQFLANMSHEIRTPLNAVIGFISLLHEKETDAEKIRYLNVIKSSSDSLLQIISDILDISKIESGKLDIDLINFNSYEELISIVELFQGKAAQEGIVLDVNYSDKIPEVLFSDVLRIKQVLSNLLSNAIKFTPKGSSVKCTIWYELGHLNVRVRDYGIGISEDKQKHIFEPFSQAESSTTRTYGGTGLGLAISVKLLKMLNSELILKSKEGRGSSFMFSIAMPEGESISKESVEDVEAKPLKGHILIVEDIEANSMFIGIILDNAGLTYDTALNGLEAIEKYKINNYDLILMDENMPKLGGIEATKIILNIEKENKLEHTPIISLTANALKGDRERFIEAGMDDYLSKPVNPKSLTDMLRRYL